MSLSVVVSQTGTRRPRRGASEFPREHVKLTVVNADNGYRTNTDSRVAFNVEVVSWPTQ
jgi:hypothetical protein